VKRADGLRVVSRRIKDSLIKRGVKESKIFVLPIYAQVEKFLAAPESVLLKKKYPEFDFIILMASRFSREKNIGLAVSAMPEVLKERPGAGLVILGAGAGKEKIIKKINKLGLNQKIKLENWTNDLAAHYKSADLFLLTSNYEGWGMSLIEAMASGLPVITTDVGCTRETLRHEENGLVAPVGDKRSLAMEIIRIINDKDLRNRLAKQALSDVKNLPTKQEYLSQYKKSWEAIL